MILLLVVGCGGDPPDPCATGGATADCLSPTQSDEYYVEQGLLYFDTLESDAKSGVAPEYAEGVARWEWPPWLLLTGYGREQMEAADAIIRLVPTEVPVRECQAFATQPFARCRVEFRYPDTSKLACPIYEEFTFDDAGRMTFIEAWADQPGISPATADDPWAERDGAERLSTRIPGLGTPEAVIDLEGPYMDAAAMVDADVADFRARALDFYDAWLEAYQAAGEDVFAQGCGW